MRPKIRRGIRKNFRAAAYSAPTRVLCAKSDLTKKFTALCTLQKNFARGEDPMHKTPEITKLIHDNFWIVLSYCFGQPAVARVINERFEGEWKYLNKSVHESAEIRADRALLEMATQLRVLDDAEHLGDYFRQTKRPPLGKVVQSDGTTTELHFRDMTNKIMHGVRYEWQLGSDEPTIVVHSDQPERWHRAEIRILPLMALIGGLMF